jgi:hypothetical protein
LDELQRALGNLVEHLRHHPEVPGLSQNQVAALMRHMQYAQRYDTIGWWGVRLHDTSSSNWPVIPGISLDVKTFYGSEFAALQDLIHEPMHDAGFFHGHINPVVGSYSMDNYYQRLYDYLKSVRSEDGTSLWSELTSPGNRR